MSFVYFLPTISIGDRFANFIQGAGLGLCLRIFPKSAGHINLVNSCVNAVYGFPVIF